MSDESILDINAIKEPTLSVPHAGKIIGVGENKAYAMAQDGSLPCIRHGRLIRVLTEPLRRKLNGEEA